MRRLGWVMLMVWAAVLGMSAVWAGEDIWLEHALSDDEAARLGRTVMPFTRESIERSGELVRDTQAASQAARVGKRPRGRVRRVALGGAGAAPIPVVWVRWGFVSALLFTDMTGAPWPIEQVLMDAQFRPSALEGGDGEGGEESAHLLYVSPQVPYLVGNVQVKLRGLAAPVVLSLVDDGGEADYTVDVRLARPGPLADPAALIQPEGFHAGDTVLLGLLGGVVPAGAERLVVVDAPGVRAWRQGVDVLLVTRAVVLSPGPWAAERDVSGLWAYRLPETPQVFVSEGGRERRLVLRAGHHDWFEPSEGGDE